MKIFLDCHSLLLKRVLEQYLQDFLYPLENCDFIVSDHVVKNPYKATCLIGSDPNAYILTPFTQGELLEKLHAFYGDQAQTQSLESRVQALLQEYTHKLLALIQDYRQ
ncbi:hypothetical protein [Helicobacter bizzozeronii]|uniref:hypothetical protein n=1 Tax=Helicobacter bizzozeronii TaxID=56877 RepID=UPI000CF0DB44|nr:hypothetical protein [Helicobacter bizzozeronii]